jgi:hypothetical protein
MVFLAVNQNSNPRMLALLHAKIGFKVDLVVESAFLNKLLKGLNHIVRPLDMAGTADTDA